MWPVNHEYYDERIGRLLEKLREAAAGSNVHILENETYEVAGWRFFGATLWTDFGLFDDRPEAMLAAGAKGTGMNDYRKIRRHDTSRLQPKHPARQTPGELASCWRRTFPRCRVPGFPIR